MNARHWLDWCKHLLKNIAVAAVLLSLSLSLSGAWFDFGSSDQSSRKSALAQGDAITDPTSLLRYALPIDNDTIRQFQEDIETMSKYLRGKRWGALSSNVKDASRILRIRRDQILASIPEADQVEASALIDELAEDVGELRESVDAKDKEEIWTRRRDILNHVSDLEQLMVQEFPFDVPEEYANLPQLKGRATVKMETTKGNLTVIVDGYSAPVNAGNFVDLVQRGFYDGLEFIPSEDFVVQAGDPPGPEEGFIDPDTGEYRAIPLEVLIRGEEQPRYGTTLEDAGIYLPELVLPFNAYGAIALARPGTDPNGGSSQFFFFKFDSELTPPGFNVMDGRYSVFGYVDQGQEVLADLAEGDKILSAKVINGAEQLVEPRKA
ncbi:MAG: peptidylprolyl isomerase [Cyanophyceae cyanobacterium]